MIDVAVGGYPDLESVMTNAVTVAEVERRLLALGFVEDRGRKTSHRQFRRMGGVKVTLSGKERDLSKKHLGMIRRQLAAAGLVL